MPEIQTPAGQAPGTPAPQTPAAPAVGSLSPEQVQSALSDPTIADKLKVKVVVDGKEQEIGFKDALKGTMMQSDYTRKMQELAAQRQALEQERAAAGVAKPPAETLLDAMEQVINRTRTQKPEDPLSNPATRREYLKSAMDKGMTPEEAIDLVLSRTDATLTSVRGEFDKSLKELREEVAATKKATEAEFQNARVTELRKRISTEVPEYRWTPTGKPANPFTSDVGFYANSDEPIAWLGGRKGVDVDPVEIAKAYKDHRLAEQKAMADAEAKRLADLRANAAGEGGAGAPGKFELSDEYKNEKDHGKRLEMLKVHEAGLRAGNPLG